MKRDAPDVAIGMCGIIKRSHDTDPDLGYALLPPYYGAGYATGEPTFVRIHLTCLFVLYFVVMMLAKRRMR